MRNPIVWTAVILALNVAAPPSSPAQQGAAEGGSFWVEIDHNTRQATLYQHRADGTTSNSPIDFEGEFRIPRRTPVSVFVVNTNSALYTCTLLQGRTAVPEIEQAKGFLTAFGPYLTDAAVWAAIPKIAMVIPPGATESSALVTARDTVEAHLHRIQQAAANANRTRLLTLEALEQMRVHPESIADYADTLEKKLRPHEPFTQSLITNIGSLTLALDELEEEIRAGGFVSPRTNQIAADARKILEGSDTMVSGAYSTRRLADVTMHATDRVKCDQPVEVTPLSGRTLTMTIAPRAMTETQRLATHGSMEVKATALPRFRIVPAVGVSLMYAPDARFSTFSTIKAPGDSAEIIESGTQDSRLTYGLTLGLRWDGAIPDENIRFYPAEITVNPTTETRAFGLGSAVSVGPIKLGAGALWTRHSVLSGQGVGQRLRDAAFLRRDNGYSPSAYFSFSVVGWPPFLSGGGGSEDKK